MSERRSATRSAWLVRATLILLLAPVNFAAPISNGKKRALDSESLTAKLVQAEAKLEVEQARRTVKP